jgi:hypothetical protein
MNEKLLEQMTRIKRLNEFQMGDNSLLSEQTNTTIQGTNQVSVKWSSEDIAKVLASVDAKGIITQGANKGITWQQFVNSNKITPQQIEAAKLLNQKNSPAPQQPKKTVFTPNENFPLKFQQKGEKVKQLQQSLKVKPTGQFWTRTEQAIAAKAKELGLTYNRAKGVDDDMFAKIVNQNNIYTGGEEPKYGDFA